MKVSCKVVPTVRSHFKRKYMNRSLSCPSCKGTSNQPNQGHRMHWNERSAYTESDSNSLLEDFQPSGNTRYEESLQTEDSFKMTDSSYHFLYVCSTFREIHENKNMLMNDQYLVHFYDQVIQYRIENGED